MPELPEVQTVIDYLKPYLINHKIEEVKVYYAPISYHKDLSLSLKNQTINDIKRRGKYICIECENICCIVHLRMEGKFFIQEIDDVLNKHTHASFYFKDFRLDFNDTRKFGRIDLTDDLNHYFEDHLGLEPFDKMCTGEYLKKQAKNRRIPVKSFILDQSVIAGIGNIYADESLWMTKIHPATRVGDISDKQLGELVENIKKVLSLSIEKGGSTDKNYVDAEGKKGSYLKFANVFRLEGQPCPRCGATIEKTTVAGRGTHTCPNCQMIQ